MSLVYNKKSPDWVKLEKSSLSEKEAQEQTIRPLRVGIINYMPDAAFIDTEKDFLRPLIEASGSHQFETIFFSPNTINRSEKTTEYILSHYTELTRVTLSQCDILIHTGANDLKEKGEGIDFTKSALAKEILNNYERAEESGVTTQIASCLSSQVIAHNKYNIPISSSINKNAKREKITGVFPHEVTEEGENNYITKNLIDEFNVVYSRNHRLSTEHIKAHPRLTSLIEGLPIDEDSPIETHFFIDPKTLFFGFQGHPEYQKHAIYKEFLRDVGLYFKTPDIHENFPTIPPHYFSSTGREKVRVFQQETQEAVQKKRNGETNIKRPQLDLDLKKDIQQTWRDTADKIWARIFNATYQITGEQSGQKITTKRGVDNYTEPLNAL